MPPCDGRWQSGETLVYERSGDTPVWCIIHSTNFAPYHTFWSQWSIGHWRSRHSPHLGISLPVWTSDFPPPLHRIQLSGLNGRLDIGVPAIPLIWASHCLCGHLISRRIPLQCPHGQPISLHYAVFDFRGLKARLDIGLPTILHI